MKFNSHFTDVGILHISNKFVPINLLAFIYVVVWKTTNLMTATIRSAGAHIYDFSLIWVWTNGDYEHVSLTLICRKLKREVHSQG
jgi:hypothetical protein